MENYNEVFREVAEEPLFTRKKTDAAMAAYTLIMMILAVSALIWNGAAMGYTVIFDVFFIASTAFLRRRGGKIPASAYVLALLTLVCSWTFAATSNTSVRLLSVVATLLSSVVWYALVAGRRYPASDSALFELSGATFFKGVDGIPKVLKALFSKKGERSKNASSAAIGVACALPLLFVVTALLASSDAAFSSLITNVFGSVGSLVQKIILGCVVSLFAIGILFTLKYGKDREKDASSPTIKTPAVTAFLAVISSVYVVYLFSQLAYLFSAFENILPAGYEFTYAEYARRGFFELCVIAAIDLVLILGAIIFTKKDNGKLPTSVKIVCTLIVLFTLVIIATSISKMVMYIGVYGMTTLRISTSAFMVWMALVFITAEIRLFVKRLDVPAVGLALGLAVLSVLGIFNVNRFVAKYNYDAHVNRGSRVDVAYMSSLGDEGVEYLYLLTHDNDIKISSAASRKLTVMIADYYETDVDYTSKITTVGELHALRKYRSGPLSFSFPSDAAYRTLDKFIEEKENG